MKVAISTDHDFVSAHFGRCQSYTIVEIKDGEVVSKEEIPNPGHRPGFLPQFLAEREVECIIAGGMGPRAQALFAGKNIQTVIGVQGQVEEVIEKFARNELEAGDDLCGHKHEEKEEGANHHADARPSSGKICITAKGDSLDSKVDPRFGRAVYFHIYDPQKEEWEVLVNENIEAAHGAGVQSAQLTAGRNVAVVLTGECGPNAERILSAAGVKIITGTTGTVKEALSNYLNS